MKLTDLLIAVVLSIIGAAAAQEQIDRASKRQVIEQAQPAAKLGDLHYAGWIAGHGLSITTNKDGWIVIQGNSAPTLSEILETLKEVEPYVGVMGGPISVTLESLSPAAELRRAADREEQRERVIAKFHDLIARLEKATLPGPTNTTRELEQTSQGGPTGPGALDAN